MTQGYFVPPEDQGVTSLDLSSVCEALFRGDMSLLNWAVSLLNIQANPAEQSHLPVGAASSWKGLKHKEVNLTHT